MLFTPAVIVFTMQIQTVWAGVYADDQAMRGKAQFEAHCTSCHRAGPANGDRFMQSWSGTDLNSLFSQMKASMPSDAPSSLSDDAYLDIVAYMLQVNAFPAGSNELQIETLKNIRVERREGPDPAPNFALVQVVGCLTEAPENTWMLTNASEPARTKNPQPSKDDELKNSEKIALGSENFRLMNVYPAPDSRKGHKVEAKGLLIRDPRGDRINVTSLQSLAPACGR
jgi:hypothetical protein